MQNSALSTAAAAAWRDFLSNKPSLAAQRAVGWLHALPAALQSADDADALVALADLAHMAGAARDDAAILAQALAVLLDVVQVVLDVVQVVMGDVHVLLEQLHPFLPANNTKKGPRSKI